MTGTVRAQNLVVRAGAAHLLERVSLQAGQGEFVGVIGPNGAGKTTLLRTIGGLLRQQSGNVFLQGQDLAQLEPREIALTLAMVHQEAPDTHGFTGLEVVLMGRYARMSHFRNEGSRDRDAAKKAMDQTETEPFAHRPLQTLSGGEKQRVMIARALAQEPAVLLLDEPTSNLDILHQFKVLELVKALVAEGCTAVATIHDLYLAARYCDRLVLMAGGRIEAEGTPREVLTTERLATVFGVRGHVRTDPDTGGLVLSILGPDLTPPILGLIGNPLRRNGEGAGTEGVPK